MDDGKKILVIDDEPDIVYTIKEICEFAGYKVLTASDGLQGVNLFKANRDVNLIIVDYHMPKYDGLLTVRKIREIDQRVSVLVLTVDERQEILERFMEVGATDFSIKPIKAPDLIARVNVNLKIQAMQEKEHQDFKEVFVTKGISETTLALVEASLKASDEGRTMRQISEDVSLAYQTVHRYINYLTDEGRVEAIKVYGNVGRPLNHYRLKY